MWVLQLFVGDGAWAGVTGVPSVAVTAAVVKILWLLLAFPLAIVAGAAETTVLPLQGSLQACLAGAGLSASFSSTLSCCMQHCGFCSTRLLFLRGAAVDVAERASSLSYQRCPGNSELHVLISVNRDSWVKQENRTLQRGSILDIRSL